jgi:HK97 gp10 family phage protein
MSKKDMGIRDFKKALLGLEAKVAKKLLRTSLRAGAKILAAEIKATAPVAEGDIKRSVKVRTGKRKKNFISIEVVVGSGDDQPHVGFVEYGRHGQLADPFMRRSVEAKRDEVLDEIADGVEAAIA